MPDPAGGGGGHGGDLLPPVHLLQRHPGLGHVLPLRLLPAPPPLGHLRQLVRELETKVHTKFRNHRGKIFANLRLTFVKSSWHTECNCSTLLQVEHRALLRQSASQFISLQRRSEQRVEDGFCHAGIFRVCRYRLQTNDHEMFFILIIFFLYIS